MRRNKKIIIIAGPNGAGKTTFAQEYLTREGDCRLFVNNDLIAAGLSPFAPTAADVRAGRLMLQEIASHVRNGESFAFETTLSGRRYQVLIPQWQRMGYEVVMIFLWLPKVEMAIERVKERVRQGGHDVPEHVIRRRYEGGWRNFSLAYKKLVDYWFLYDNSERVPVLLGKGMNA
jgi:predicted ABC-type ATPase